MAAFWLTVIGTSLWMFFESRSFRYERRSLPKGMPALGPWGWFCAGLVLWVVVFPFYLFSRGKLRAAGAASPRGKPGGLAVVVNAISTVGVLFLALILAIIAAAPQVDPQKAAAPQAPAVSHQPPPPPEPVHSSQTTLVASAPMPVAALPEPPAAAVAEGVAPKLSATDEVFARVQKALDTADLAGAEVAIVDAEALLPQLAAKEKRQASKRLKDALSGVHGLRVSAAVGLIVDAGRASPNDGGGLLDRADALLRANRDPEAKEAKRMLAGARKDLKQRIELAAAQKFCGQRPVPSGWDGEIAGIESALKRTAHDPGSIDVENCTVLRMEAPPRCWIARCMVRGKNGFGALVASVKTFHLAESVEYKGIYQVLGMD